MPAVPTLTLWCADHADQAPPASTPQTTEAEQDHRDEDVLPQRSAQHEHRAPYRPPPLQHQQQSGKTRDQATQTNPVEIRALVPTPEPAVLDWDAFLLELGVGPAH